MRKHTIAVAAATTGLAVAGLAAVATAVPANHQHLMLRTMATPACV